VRNIRRGIEALIVPNLLNRVTARWNLANALTAYAQTLGTAEAYCAAAEQLQAAAAVLPDSDVLGRLGEYQAQCLRAQRLAALEGAVQQLSGRLLYSTQEGDRYLIYQAPARREGPSGLLIADGAQPARQRSGPIVAFHSTRPSDGGIVAYNLFTTSDPNERTQRITTVPEDARDAPPSWSPDNLALVYASTSSGDRRSRIYLLNINKGGNATDLGLGKDPAFNPIDGRIIYNGVNNVGSEPGLWMMAPDGSSRVRLTDNGNDMRPAWTPDGRYVVFMSTRNGNWDLYRVGVEDGSVMQLTERWAVRGLCQRPGRLLAHICGLYRRRP
ncbi:MAG: PD40 domain-containing protein, partial [Caldilineaceae bacterium]|nr:PD40 domain-containing protein [Caldilineaceae bacterium]